LACVEAGTSAGRRLLIERANGEPSDWVAVPGGRVACWRAGEGSRWPLLCLHGGPGFPHDYLAPLAQLGEERQVIFYDQLGCGRSERPANTSLWTLERSVDELVAVVAELRLDRFHLFGNSFGGWLALQAVLDRRVAPRSLVLSSSPPSVPRWVEDCAALRKRLPRRVEETIRHHESQGFFGCPEFVAAMTEFYRRHLCRLNVWPVELERAFAGFGTEVYETMWGPSEFGPVTGVLKDWDVTSRVHEIATPSLVTGGRYDEATPAHMKVLKEQLQDAEMVVFQRSAHVAFLEEPDAYLSTVQSFLERVESRTA
jgi:proline-specific peptidase